MTVSSVFRGKLCIGSRNPFLMSLAPATMVIFSHLCKFDFNLTAF